MIQQPKYKICRRLGPGVFEKCQNPKFALSQERKSKNKMKGKRRKSVSDYGMQLLEKQKVRFTYAISEKQFAGYVKSAAAKHGIDKSQYLYEALESRLDNVAYRLGFAPTRFGARQLVSHGHLSVNGVRVTVPSYKTKAGDVIALRERTKNKAFYPRIVEQVGKMNFPTWITFDSEKMTATMTGKPELKKDDSTFNLTTVIEFYSI